MIEFENKKINLTKSVESNKLKILQDLPSICVNFLTIYMKKLWKKK